MSDISPHQIDTLFAALEEQLRAADARYEIVVIGGTALLALGLAARPTRDVDVVALRDGERLVRPEPLPEPLVAARRRVRRDFGLIEGWLNAAPSPLLDLGLPDGFADRLTCRSYGPALAVHFASRLDQIHFKLYAAADEGPGRHEQDLRALNPSRDELLHAAEWAKTHDPSPAFEMEMAGCLRALGVAP